MMLDDLYQSDSDAVINDMVARPKPLPPQAAKFSAWKLTTAAPRGVGAGANESAGFMADVLGAFGQVVGAYPEIMGSQATPETEQQRAKIKTQGIDYSSAAGDSFRESVKLFMPDPQTAHTAETLTFGLGRFASKAVGYTALGGAVVGAGLLGADEGMTAADALKQQGVDLETRTKVGAVTGVTSAMAPLLPVAGSTALQTAGLVALGGPGSFIAQQAATREILQAAGYDHLSTQYDPFDPVGLAVSTLVPAGFGAMAMRGVKLRDAAAKAEQTRVAEAIKAEQEAAQNGPPRPTQEHVDAARVEMLSQHIEQSGLFKPDDAKAAAMHVAAYAKSMEDLSSGRRVDVTDLVPVERLEMSKALDTFSQGIESARADLLYQAAQRAEPGAVRQMQTDLAEAQARLAEVQGPVAVKARASELQQTERLSFKQALVKAQKEFDAQAKDISARVDRLESAIADNAQGQQAFDVLNKLDKQAQEIAAQRAQLDAPAARQTPTALAAKQAIEQVKTPGQTNVKDAPQAAPATAGAVQADTSPTTSQAAQPSPEVARSPGARPADGGGSSAGSAGGAAEAAVVAQRLTDIQAQFPDLTVQMDGMDKPMPLSEFLAQVQREAMEGTDFDLGGNDAPLMQVATSCFLVNG